MRSNKKTLLALLFLMSSTFMFSQSKEALVDELTDLIKAKNRLADVFFTEYSGELNINGNQIPIAQTRCYYEESKGPTLGFQCVLRTNINCIYKPKEDRSIEKFLIPIDDEESARRAMELIEQLK